MSKFSERLKLLRTEHGLSQQEFAKQLGNISKSSINMYERGEREPGLETLEAIADFFNVDMDYLLGKSDVPNRNADWMSALMQRMAEGKNDSLRTTNIVRIAARDGSLVEKRLTDEQVKALKAIVDQLPDAGDL